MNRYLTHVDVETTHKPKPHGHVFHRVELKTPRRVSQAVASTGYAAERVVVSRVKVPGV